MFQHFLSDEVGAPPLVPSSPLAYPGRGRGRGPGTMVTSAVGDSLARSVTYCRCGPSHPSPHSLPLSGVWTGRWRPVGDRQHGD